MSNSLLMIYNLLKNKIKHSNEILIQNIIIHSCIRICKFIATMCRVPLGNELPSPDHAPRMRGAG